MAKISHEETEVKKDTEWLKREIPNLRGHVVIIDGEDGKWEPITTVSMKDVYKLIDQLDEPEVNGQIDKLANFIMSEVEGEPSQNQGAVDTAIRIIKSYQNQETLSQEWIDEHTYHEDEYDFYYADPDELKNLLVPKQELPAIPQFVAEFLIGKEDYMLYELFDDEWLYKEHDRVAKWLYDNDELTNKQREIDLVMARDRGYEVEEEPKYIIDTDDIEISDGNHYLTNLTLSKDSSELPIVGYKSDAIRFDDINQAQAIASYVGGRVEELEE